MIWMRRIVHCGEEEEGIERGELSRAGQNKNKNKNKNKNQNKNKNKNKNKNRKKT